MNKRSKEIKLIGPPHWYKDDEENIGELEATSANVSKLEVPEKVRQWPDPEAEVDDTD